MNDDPLHVLLVEDNLQLTQLITELLSQPGTTTFILESCSSLARAVERLEKPGIDLVVLDLALPDSSGLDSLERLRAQAPDLPIVVLTALEDEKTALRALREGAQDYLLKGEINHTMLTRALRYAVERKRGEEARSRLAAIVDSSQDAIVGMSLEGIIVSWNAGAQNIFGYDFEDVIGRPVSVLAPAGGEDEMSGIIERLQRGEFVRDFETLRTKKDQREFYVAVSVSPIKNSLGQMMGASLIARDIEDRKRAEKERELLIQQLQAALAQVNTLSGLLPICASCKKIRDDKGYWTQVEVYVKNRSTAEFTHGICPECAETYRAAVCRKL